MDDDVQTVVAVMCTSLGRCGFIYGRTVPAMNQFNGCSSSHQPQFHGGGSGWKNISATMLPPSRHCQIIRTTSSRTYRRQVKRRRTRYRNDSATGLALAKSRGWGGWYVNLLPLLTRLPRWSAPQSSRLRSSKHFHTLLGLVTSLTARP